MWPMHRQDPDLVCVRLMNQCKLCVQPMAAVQHLQHTFQAPAGKAEVVDTPQQEGTVMAAPQQGSNQGVYGCAQLCRCWLHHLRTGVLAIPQLHREPQTKLAAPDDVNIVGCCRAEVGARYCEFCS